MLIGIPILVVLFLILIVNNLIEIIFSVIAIFNMVRSYFCKNGKLNKKNEISEIKNDLNESNVELNNDILNSNDSKIPPKNIREKNSRNSVPKMGLNRPRKRTNIKIPMNQIVRQNEEEINVGENSI